VPITLQVGHGDQRQRSAIPPRRIVRFDAVAPDGSRRDLAAGLHPGAAADDGVLALPAPGVWVVALQSDNHGQSHQPAARFNAYLAAEGLTPALAARRAAHREAADGSERFVRAAKALVRTGPGGGAATTPVGLPLEIVPEADPYAADRGAHLPVRVLYLGRPLAGARIELTDLAHDAAPAEVRRTDRAGRAVFAMPTAGDWLLNVVWTRPLPPTDEVDFETVFSSLSFGLPAEAARSPVGPGRRPSSLGTEPSDGG
jgi:hypothetical protein